MIVYRLGRSKYAADLAGKGAEKTGGRWNSKGVGMIYSCASRALCTAEVAVHMPLGIIPADYVMISLDIPAAMAIGEITQSPLPSGWKTFPHPHSTQKEGDDFISKGKFAVLKVPSVVVQGEFNYLLNPRHKDFKKIRQGMVEPFSFDERLFKK